MIVTNAHIYLAIAEEALAEVQKFRTPKPNGEVGCIVKYDPNQKSFKQSLVAIIFSANYLEACFYLAGVKKFGQQKYEEQIDRKSYKEKAQLFGIQDIEIINSVEKLRDVRKEIVHEKFHDPKQKKERIAHIEAENAVTLVKRLVPLLFE